MLLLKIEKLDNWVFISLLKHFNTFFRQIRKHIKITENILLEQLPVLIFSAQLKTNNEFTKSF